MKRILLFIVGVGAGNTTRTLAWAGELKKIAPEIDLQIAAQGKAFELLSEHFDVHPMRTISYGTGSFSGLSIIRQNLSFPLRFRENQQLAKQYIDELRPQLILADSDFYCLGPAKRSNAMLGTINSSPVTMAQLRREGVPANSGFSGHVIERADEWLQRHYSDLVICPTIQPEKGLGSRVHQIPPIVRAKFAPNDQVKEQVVAVTGGSGIGANGIDLSRVSVPIATYGSEITNVPKHAEQFGFTTTLEDEMCSAKVLVVQGGFSSVSEAIASRRPVVVIPIPGHAEQIMNAREVERLGVGKMTSPEKASETVMDVWNNLQRYEAAIKSHNLPVNGAIKAAEKIVDVLS